MSLLSVDDALAAITAALTPVCVEEISMIEAGTPSADTTLMGRVLAADVAAMVSHPPHDVSAMDGYAVCQDDLNKGELTVIGESAAGHPFEGSVGKGEAVRIFTGAYCPRGSDTIIIQEDAEQDGSRLNVRETAPKGKFIRAQGNDFKQGDVIAKQGEPLTPRLLALIASAGVKTITLYRRPRVAIISTGDELVPPGADTKAGQIISSNGVFLKHFLIQSGAEPIDLGIVPDNDEALEAAFTAAASADLIITSGGASVGQHDGVAKAMTGGDASDDHEAATLNFWRIAMRPGKPLIFGAINGVPILGLPGNPVSTGVCAMIFGSVALKVMTGQDISQDWGLPIKHGRLTIPLNANDKRQDYLRAGRHYEDGMAVLTPFEQQDSGMMQYFAKADVLVIRPPFAEAADAGEMVAYLDIPSGF